MFTPDIVVHFRDVSYVISVQSKAAIYFSQCHLQTIDLYCENYCEKTNEECKGVIKSRNSKDEEWVKAKRTTR